MFRVLYQGAVRHLIIAVFLCFLHSYHRLVLCLLLLFLSGRCVLGTFNGNEG